MVLVEAINLHLGNPLRCIVVEGLNLRYFPSLKMRFVGCMRISLIIKRRRRRVLSYRLGLLVQGGRAFQSKRSKIFIIYSVQWRNSKKKNMTMKEQRYRVGGGIPINFQYFPDD